MKNIFLILLFALYGLSLTGQYLGSLKYRETYIDCYKRAWINQNSVSFSSEFSAILFFINTLNIVDGISDIEDNYGNQMFTFRKNGDRIEMTDYYEQDLKVFYSIKSLRNCLFERIMNRYLEDTLFDN